MIDVMCNKCGKNKVAQASSEEALLTVFIMCGPCAGVSLPALPPEPTKEGA